MSEPFTGASPETLDLLLRRRSTSPKAMGEPGPDAVQLRTILQVAARVPDHGKLFPWRFIVFAAEGRESFGRVLEEALVARNRNAGESLRRFERSRFLRAPVIVAVISSPVIGNAVPEWEQHLSAGAVCQNMIIAAIASGFGAGWVTEWCAYDEIVADRLGLGPAEKVAGFVYIGTATTEPVERERPVLDDLVSFWGEHRI